MVKLVVVFDGAICVAIVEISQIYKFTVQVFDKYLTVCDI